jgi:hypothetical protein
MMNDPQIWKVPVSSRRGDMSVAKVDEARQFCFGEGWVGIGWELDQVPDNCRIPQLYAAVLMKLAVEQLAPFTNVDAALMAHRAIAEKMQVGDFVWCRARNDIYWLGKVTGGWEYRKTSDFNNFDLFQVRKCEWHEVGPSDCVPGPVKNAYAGRGSAICRVNRESETAAKECVRIWDNLSALSGEFPLSAIGHDDLEDIVMLYLQAKFGWFVILSTAKRATPTTECVLRNVMGQRAYVQVKSGKTPCDYQVVIPESVDRFFMFDLCADRPRDSAGKIARIEPIELIDFIQAHAELFPLRLRRLHL